MDENEDRRGRPGDSSLVEALRKFAGRKMTAEEIREQRVSFVFGQLGGKITKDEVRAEIAHSVGEL